MAWYGESRRHALAAKGIRTAQQKIRARTLSDISRIKKEHDTPYWLLRGDKRQKQRLEMLAEIAVDVGLEGETFSDFVRYYSARDFNIDPSYMTEWANRFKNGAEFYRSDSTGQKLLLQLNPKKYIKMNRIWGSKDNLYALEAIGYNPEEIDYEIREWMRHNPST